MSNYAKWRPRLLLIIGLLIVAAVAYWAYKDFITPSSLQKNNTPQSVSTESVSKSTPPNDNEVRSYTVLPTHPRRIVVVSVSINALIKPVDVRENGALDAPKTAWDVGWYKDSGLPGQPGVMLLDGHVNDSYNTPGVFANLKKTKPGDEIMIERGDGAMVSYRIVSTEQVPLAQVDMKRLLQPIQGAEGLNLITCGGSYDKKAATFNDRILVFAKRA